MLLLLGGAAVLTLAAGPVLGLARPQRRVRRSLVRGIGARPDAELITADTGAGFCLETNIIAVSWAKGRWRLDFSLDELLGAEILIDDVVAARAFRGEARLPLERITADADNVCVRLLFDDPRHPDFEISVWPTSSPPTKDLATPAAAVREANTWLMRIENIVRRLDRTAPIIRADVSEPAGMVSGRDVVEGADDE